MQVEDELLLKTHAACQWPQRYSDRLLATKSRFSGFFYIDAFAGPGRHEIRKAAPPCDLTQQLFADTAAFGRASEEQRQFLAGSPRVALGVAPPFTAYVFVERSADRVAELERLKAEFGGTRKIVIRKTDCTRYLLEMVANNPKVEWARNRAIVFLDPFGMQVAWNTLAALAKTKAIEVLINFPVGMAIQRLLKRRPDEFSIAERNKLDEYFGSPGWFEALYKPRRTLFGDEENAKVERSGKALLEWYRSRLRQLFGFASRASLVRNTLGGHLYYLLLATPNKTGEKIASDILSAGEWV